MYSPFQLALKFIKYHLKASNGKGHGIHSPFVFEFVTKVINDKRHFYAYDKIEELRSNLLLNKEVLTIQDFGAGSTISKGNERKVKDIAQSALKPKKFGQLMFRMVDFYHLNTMVELGTSLGITTAYLASGNALGKVYTFEGASEVAATARENFQQLELKNIELVEGNFDDTLPAQLKPLNSIDLAFVDGNHRKIPTVRYFEQLLEKASKNSIFIFDDIHWSREMEEAWKYIQHHSAVTLTIDLFFIGIVFFRTEQRVQQHFSIRF
jgi:predicted O-methyltransferase YrrM